MPLPFRLVYFVSLLLLIATGSFAQEIVAERGLTLTTTSSKIIEFSPAGLHALTADWEDGRKPESLFYRFVKKDKRFTEWLPWSLENEAGVSAATLLTLRGDIKRLEIKSTSNYDVRVEALSYEVSPSRRITRENLESNACPCPSPAAVMRSAWCPDGSCISQGTPTPVNPNFLIVHHSGSDVTGVDYSLVVKAIYDYHVGTNGWDDIGYNLLIAPDGTLFEGRGTAIQGAHMCSANAETLGVCMIGNYESTALPTPALNTLVNLGSFLSCEFDIDPLTSMFHAPSGKTLDGLAGHRDGCATACPGEQLYDLLPTLRNAIAGKIERGCTAIAAPQRLTANSLNDGAVGLMWSAYPTASLILVERASGTSNRFELVAEVIGDLTRYTDNTAPSGQNFYRIRALVDGNLSEYSNEASLSVSSSEAAALPPAIKPRLARNPVKNIIEIEGLRAPVDMAFISDSNGRTVLELKGSTPRWSIQSGDIPTGRYWIMLFSGNEWFTVPFDFRP